MKISLKWLNDFINIKNVDAHQIEKELTDLGLECSIFKENKLDPLIVVGEVLKVKKHPDADKLNICTVDTGEIKPLEIICGAPNVKEDIIVPVAKVGARIGKINISKAKLRGVYSFGMICSGKELNINNDHEGIMILDSNYKIGVSLNELINNDTLIDIDLTPNRGDCFSHLGVAREISTFINNKLKYKTPVYKSADFKTSDMIDIKIDKKICTRYSAILIKNITVEDSPEWLKNRLNGIGCKSINNIVDIANYIMYDLGQPLHTFDYDKINNKKIHVKLAKQNQKINTISDISIKLNSNDIIISDGSEALAVAGIIGGYKSQVTSNTKNILLESAVFKDIFIRRSSKSHDLSTESSKRFERGVDPNNIIFGMQKFIQLLQGISDCDPSLEYVDIYPKKIKNKKIKFDLNSCNRYLGSDISLKEFKSIFIKLFIKPLENNFYEIPSYRNDLENEIDLYEEVARVYGYNNIIANPTFVVPYVSIKGDNQVLENLLRQSLSNNGFNEHYSNSLYSKKDIDNSNNKAVKLKNPLSREFEYLRNDLVPGLLKAVSYNLNRKNNFIKMFEIGSIQIANTKKYNLCDEKRSLAVIWAGNKTNHWKYPNLIDIYTIKGQVDLILNNIGIENFNFIYSDNEITISINSVTIGKISILNNEILNKYDIEEQVIVFTLSIDVVENYFNKRDLKYKKTSQYPGIKRDISLIVHSKHNNIDLEKNMYSNGGKYLINVNLFDYYIDKKIASDKKSLAYSLEFKSDNKTLKDSEVNSQMDKIINSLIKKFKVIQR